MGTDLPEDQSGDIHKQYDRALILIQYYVQLTWLVFGSFLLSETVLLAAIATAAKDSPRFAFLAAIFGILLALPWWSSFRYNHALYRLRIAEARGMEPAAGTFFTSGAALIEGKSVDTANGSIPIPALARLLSPSRSVQLLILLFVVSFLVVVVTYWPWQCKY